MLISNQISVFIDETNELNVHQVSSGKHEFIKNKTDIINIQVTPHTVWLKFEIENNTNLNQILLEIRKPNLDELILYKKKDQHFRSEGPYGQSFKYSDREYDHPHFIFDLDLRVGEKSTFYLRIKNADLTTLPIQIGTVKAIMEGLFNYEVANGVYLGIFLVMFLYNLFLYFTTKNRTYLTYSIFVFAMGLGLFTMSGYSFKYFWPQSPWLETRAFVIVSAIIPIAALAFSISFLKLKLYMPWARKILIGFIVGYFIVFLLAFFGQIAIGQQGVLALSISVFITFGIALKLATKGIREAKFYLAAWTIYLIGIIVFLLTDTGIIAYNQITTRMLHFGSAMEVVLLSFALGDYINTLRKEKEDSQKQALEELQRNELIIKEQNVKLEDRVKIRTVELERTNTDLSHAIVELKDAQSQLVDAEKMASLGQLTAGIAHEINNPINFVSSNVSPLKQDIEDLVEVINEYEKSTSESGISAEDTHRINELKENLDLKFTVNEIETLLGGIKDGADRTAEIVKGLKSFSRLDESTFKKANVNEGIESTLLILKSKFDSIHIEKQYGSIEQIECLPGKLNQLFMNILDNSVYACNKKEYKNEETPTIQITTSQNAEETTISLKDNGIGMEEEVKNKIFEPFFTTKDVGEGTGLGMSIAHGIITNHNGKVKIISEPQKGTEIIINLPRVI